MAFVLLLIPFGKDVSGLLVDEVVGATTLQGRILQDVIDLPSV